MTKNYMSEVAKMLGVELGEEFKIKGRENSRYKLTEEGMWTNGVFGWERIRMDLEMVLNGQYNIEKLPWKPKDGDKYFYVCWHYFANRAIFTSSSVFNIMSETECLRVDIGNCFRTYDEAEAQKYEVFKRLTGKDWHEIYGKEGGSNEAD